MLIGVIGAGVMGTGIAQTFAMKKGNQVILSDVSTAFARRGKETIISRLHSMVQKGKLLQELCDEIIGRIAIGEITDLCNCTIVIEAVKEEMKVKKCLFAELDKNCSTDTVFASNTSALSLGEMSEGLTRPVVGMHFFNPVPQMALIEVVGTAGTAPELLERVCTIAEELGKVPIMVKERSGFVVNRILIPMINEAIGVYAEGVASAKDIDMAMRLGANHPIGPLALADLIGLDVCLAIMQVLKTDLKNEKYQPHPLLEEMVKKGIMGRKTGCGFYEYPR